MVPMIAALVGAPFDRLIVATASLSGARLLTADATILENYTGAWWD